MQMNEHPSKRLFGILSQILVSDSPHTFGAIFDVDANGLVTGFTPIDFDGRTLRGWPNNVIGDANSVDIPHTSPEKAILFPITEETATRLCETMSYIGKEGRKRFKHVGGARPNGSFADFVRPSQATGIVETTCRDFLMNALKVVGMPIEDIKGNGEALPAFESSGAVYEFIQSMAGNRGVFYQGKRTTKMHEAGNGRLFCAYDGFGDILEALNALPRESDGRTVAQTVLDSEPFYGPHLGHVGSAQRQPDTTKFVVGR